jgi:hypothetical protein
VGKGGTTFTRDEVDEIGDADAFWLLIQLEFRHAARDAPFALQFRRMAAEQSIAGMGEHRLRAAARRLEQAGYLARLHAGGDHPGDAAQYRLRRPRRTTRV